MSNTGLHPEAYRAAFPHTAERVIYLNHAALSPLPAATVFAVQRSLENRQHFPVDDFLSADFPVLEQTRQRLAQLIGATDNSRIAFTPNTSFALNIIASGFPFVPGDEVLLFDEEFPSNVYPWLVQQMRGVEVRRFSGINGCFTLDDITRALTPRTRILALSAVQFVSGFRADLRTISEICRSNGTFLVVDAIQALGQSPVCVQTDGIDALCSGCHKWLLSPQGLGCMYMSEAFQEQITVTAKGWLSVVSVWDLFDTVQPLNPGMSRFEPGTFNLPAIHGLNESLKLIHEAGPTRIRAHVLELGNRMRAQLEPTSLRLYGPENDENRSAILTFRLPENKSPEAIQTHLFRNRVIASVRNGLLRFSPYFYNTKAEIDAAASILADGLASS